MFLRTRAGRQQRQQRQARYQLLAKNDPTSSPTPRLCLVYSFLRSRGSSMDALGRCLR